MMRSLFAGLLAAALIAAPLPMLATAAAAAPANKADAAKPKKAKKPPSAGQQAMHERQKKCGAEWRAAKKAGKIEKGITWPKYWSACNKRLKAGG